MKTYQENFSRHIDRAKQAGETEKERWTAILVYILWTAIFFYILKATLEALGS